MRALAILLLAATPIPATHGCRVATGAACATRDPHWTRHAAPIGVSFPPLFDPNRKVRL